MIIASWNIRGFNSPLKQDEVFHLICDHRIDVFGLLKSKATPLIVKSFVDCRLPGWSFCHNFETHAHGRIALFLESLKSGCSGPRDISSGRSFVDNLYCYSLDLSHEFCLWTALYCELASALSRTQQNSRPLPPTVDGSW